MQGLSMEIQIKGYGMPAIIRRNGAGLYGRCPPFVGTGFSAKYVS
jgi:hypothetical protein